jgi:hypothetical protein
MKDHIYLANCCMDIRCKTSLYNIVFVFKKRQVIWSWHHQCTPGWVMLLSLFSQAFNSVFLSQQINISQNQLVIQQCFKFMKADGP